MQNNRSEKYPDRLLDATAANILVSFDKVIQINNGDIPLPEVVEIFLTNYCQFKCPFCRCAPYHGTNNQFLDINSISRLLKELSEVNVKTIELGGGGEPLLHPNICDIFDTFKKMSFRVGLITNGYCLIDNSKLMDFLLPVCDWIRFSIDAVTDDAYRIVHGMPKIAYTELRKAIIKMKNKIDALPRNIEKPKIGSKLIIQESNKEQLVSMIDEAIQIGVDYVQFKWLENNATSIPFEARQDVINPLHDKLASMAQSNLLVDILPGYGGPKVKGKCIMSVLHPLVNWDGNVFICAFFHHRKESHLIGNISKDGFFEIWGSKKHREKISNVNPEECVANCPLLRYNPIVDFINREKFRFKYI